MVVFPGPDLAGAGFSGHGVAAADNQDEAILEETLTEDLARGDRVLR